jgi:hypothetical protein
LNRGDWQVAKLEVWAVGRAGKAAGLAKYAVGRAEYRLEDKQDILVD